MKKYISLLIISILTINAYSQKYEDIYYNLPNITLDQAYTDLFEFQKQNPQFANTYIQLGIICEQKMVLVDPLLDASSLRFWAKNADLFFGNFDAYFSASDVRSNAEFYENLKIAHQGAKLTEIDVHKYVEQHKLFCKNYNDTTKLAFEALEASKTYYDKCIASFKNLCNTYSTRNEMLLKADDNLLLQIKQIASNIESCVAKFAEYKEITKKFHIQNYRQIFDYKTIETYRLDGLTQSNFYKNRFYIWNFEKWTSEFLKQIADEILPLRQRLVDIDEYYSQVKYEFDTYHQATKATNSPLDSHLLSQIGKYDSNSLVCKLLECLEARRQMIILANENIHLNKDTSATIFAQKKRNIYRIAKAMAISDEKLASAKKLINEENINRFKDFFNQRYKGIDGVNQFINSEKTYTRSLLVSQLEDLRNYEKLLNIKNLTEHYSTKTAKYAAVPLFKVRETQNIQGQYATTHIVYNQNGQPSVVAGTKRGTQQSLFVAKVAPNGATEWISEIKKATDVRHLSQNAGIIMVAVTQNELPNIVVFSDKGKELSNKPLNEGKIAFATYSDITKRGYIAFNIVNGNVAICQTDSLGSKTWESIVWQQAQVVDMSETPEGIIAYANSDNGIEAAAIDIMGNVKRTKICQSLKLESIYRVSAQEICLFCVDNSGKKQMILVDDKNNVLINTQQ